MVFGSENECPVFLLGGFESRVALRSSGCCVAGKAYARRARCGPVQPFRCAPQQCPLLGSHWRRASFGFGARTDQVLGLVLAPALLDLRRMPVIVPGRTTGPECPH